MTFNHLDYMHYPILGYRVSLTEFPEHISFVIEMGNCLQQCPWCHREDMQTFNQEPMFTNIVSIEEAVKEAVDKGANGIIIMGGTTNGLLMYDVCILIDRLSVYAPVCLYSGSNNPYKHEIIVKSSNLSALKTGSYKKELGGLNSPTTNQRFYLIEKGGTDSSKVMVDITHKFYDENTNDQPKKR